MVPKISWRPWLEPTNFIAFEALKFSPYFGCFPRICTLRVSSVHNLIIFFSSHIFIYFEVILPQQISVTQYSVINSSHH